MSDGWPVINETWGRGERPPGTPEQVRAWLLASLEPLAVRIVRGNEDGDVWFWWEECRGGGWLAPMDGRAMVQAFVAVEGRPPEEGEQQLRGAPVWVQFPDEHTVWQPVRHALTFRAPLARFLEYFWRVP